MKALYTIYISLILSVLFAGCAPQASPEETTQQFWQAVIHNDSSTVRRLLAPNTLGNPELLSNKDGNLIGVEAGAAHLSADGKKAEVPTILIGKVDGQETRVAITTFLIRQDKAWKVDGQQSVDSMVAASIELMMKSVTGNLAEVGQEINAAISSGMTEFLSGLQKGLPTLKQELERLNSQGKAEELGRQFGELLSQGLGAALENFNQGLDELSKELEAAKQPPATTPNP